MDTRSQGNLERGGSAERDAEPRAAPAPHAAASASGFRYRRTWGVVCALPEELGDLRGGAARSWSHLGLELHESAVAGARVLGCVAGVGKVAAARAATVLLAAGVDRALLVVGTCGGLRQRLVPGTFLHCRTAIQVDLGPRAGRESASDPELRSAWRALVPAEEGWFLTADRPVLSFLRRVRLARAFAGPCVADMETAAVAAVAHQAGIPWAALRAVTDRASWLGGASFRLNYATQAGRAADTVRPLVTALEGPN